MVFNMSKFSNPIHDDDARNSLIALLESDPPDCTNGLICVIIDCARRIWRFASLPTLIQSSIMQGERHPWLLVEEDTDLSDDLRPAHRNFGREPALQ
jgi:hypothetical protein